ncbi:hypothetical protein OAV41_02980 [Planctomycetota bacterium]|nr:hypothetical protein [Planctomycetota bacterium]
MKRNKIAFLALIYVASFFMPSYHGGEGYGCAQMCLTPSLGNYYFIFTFTNLLTIFFVISLLANISQGKKTLKWIGAFLIAHLCTWPLFHLCTWPSFVKYHVPGSLFDSTDKQIAPIPDIGDIGIGFYFWCFSIILIWFTYCKSNKSLK